MLELIMHHAEKRGMHKEASFECMKRFMEKAFKEAEEELE